MADSELVQIYCCVQKKLSSSSVIREITWGLFMRQN